MTRKRSRASKSKTSQLEAKLDSIVSLLQTNQSSTSANILAEWGSAASSTPNSSETNSMPFDDGCHSDPTSSPGYSTIMEYCQSIPIPLKESEKLICQFRSQNLKSLPFIYLPTHLTSPQLRQEKPFLWLCIMAVTVPGNNERDILFKKVTEIIRQELLVSITSSMDMLLGVMTFISWTTFSKKPFLNFYSHMILGILCDLGLNKAPFKELSTMQAFKCAVGWKLPVLIERTLEERRAALGVFLITSSVASAICKIDAMRWNSYMEECLVVLTDGKECPEDEILVSLVKIQVIIDKVYHLRRDGYIDPPPQFYTHSFQSQLDSVKAELPQHAREDRTVHMYISSAELVIHESEMQTPLMSNSPELHRLEGLYTALHASKAWFDNWFTAFPKGYKGVPFTIVFQFGRALISLYNLSTLDDPTWDKTTVRNTANVLEILERLVTSMTTLPDSISGSPDEHLYEKGVKMMESIKKSWEPKLMETWFPSIPANTMGGEFVPNPSLQEVLPMNGFDDYWMVEIFGSL
ncbi:hypothetical protein N7495_005821 [Penicillium taxi]|uniref:uncharacterized protein n=1 Tax=Penicillium taxi TaxID=168475 RepID=UPI00254516A1|nr:uncharacterized protein N7495_005821 [Penicillium taxi]KAJ5894130.1 hypothetical protein N7495_005821 [Penicillium taxi]